MNKQPPTGASARKRKEAPNTGTNPAKNTPPSQSNARLQKRAKLYDARTIRAQPSDAALRDGELDLQSFLSAREFEIAALESAMRKSKAAATTRAFQKVPRGMRRRTASHNVKRVPKRLRARAEKEMAEDNTPTVESRKRRPRTTRARIRAEMARKVGGLVERKRRRRERKIAAAAAAQGEDGVDSGKAAGKPTVHTRPPRPKIRRNELNEPPRPKSKFKKRQINKTWLPTHMWHAKRARMTDPKDPLWRFAIPLTPTEKCYRPTHRATGERGVVVWDTSYMSTIGLYGSAEGMMRVLTAMGLSKELFVGDKHRKWRSGLRNRSVMLSKEVKGARKEIGPAVIMWNPEEEHADTAEGQASKTQRQVFLRVHPSCFFVVFNELVRLVKLQKPQLYVEDLRFEIGSIELTGPASTEALLAVLHPYHRASETEEQHAKVFKSLAGVTNPSSLPPGALLAFSIMDPRLRHPPKKIQIDGEELSLLETLTKWPVGDVPQPHGLFDRTARFQASALPSQSSLDRRKGMATPGLELGITAADPPIPILLLASRPPGRKQAQGTWTLMAPWKCILPIWRNLVKVPLSTGGNPRLGGLDEIRQVKFEHGLPWFPGDYVGTAAGVEWELEQRARRRAEYGRRPKSKRVSWEALDLGAGRKGEVGDGLACDFEYLFGLPKDEPVPAKGAKEKDADPVVVGADENSRDIDKLNTDVEKSKEKLQRQDISRSSLSQLHRLSPSAFSALLKAKNQLSPNPPCGIITVTLTFLGRGVAVPCARIYRLPTHNPVLVLPSTQAEVPATPSQPGSGVSSLPGDLRERWLSQLSKGSTSCPQDRPVPPPRRIPADADLSVRKKIMAGSLLCPPDGPLPWAWEVAAKKNEGVDLEGCRPLCPGEEDLMGFVTTGGFCLADGKAKAAGSLGVARAVEAVEAVGRGGEEEGRVCVVRNAGERVGWLARWEVV